MLGTLAGPNFKVGVISYPHLWGRVNLILSFLSPLDKNSACIALSNQKALLFRQSSALLKNKASLLASRNSKNQRQTASEFGIHKQLSFANFFILKSFVLSGKVPWLNGWMIGYHNSQALWLLEKLLIFQFWGNLHASFVVWLLRKLRKVYKGGKFVEWFAFI